MRVVKLETMFQASDWRRQFADHLIRLQPDMNPDAADEVSDAEYRRSHRLAPAEAAQRFFTAHSRGRPVDEANVDVVPQASGGEHG